MTRRRYPTLLCALSCVALLAGCGGSSSSSTSTPSSSSSTAPSGSSATAPPSGSASNAAIQAAVKECKALVASETTLSQGAREKLEGACSKAAQGDTAAVKKAAREVCEEVIEKSPLPTAAREQTLLNCRK